MFFSNTSSYACSYRQWHYLGAPIWKNRQFPGWWRDGDANSLQYLAAVPKALAADTKLFPVFLDGDFLNSFEVLFYVRPFDAAMAGGFGPPVDLFSGPTQESYRKHDHEWFRRADEKPALAWLQTDFMSMETLPLPILTNRKWTGQRGRPLPLERPGKHRCRSALA